MSSGIAVPVYAQPRVVINEVYGGGQNTGSFYDKDFIELFNAGDAAQDLAGWSVQYASAAGTGGWFVTLLPAVYLQPGQHFLIQQYGNPGGTGGTQPIPTPDVIGVTLMAQASAKVALVRSSTALTGTCPTDSDIVDFVGYGQSATCWEGSGPTQTLTSATSASRRNGGYLDTNDNATDFFVGIPTPQNSNGVLGAPVAAVPPCIGVIAPPLPGQNKLVLVTHGANTDHATFVAVWEEMRTAIEMHGGPNGSPIGPDWAVRSYEWTCDTGGSPEDALGRATIHGIQLGFLIAEQGYDHVHLIAHSAGSGLIATTALAIRLDAIVNMREVTVHTTYLDAYGGNYIVPGVGNVQSLYGANADWSDHYFSTEQPGLLYSCALLQGEPITGPVTELELADSYNLDVSRLDPSYNFYCHSRHSWPHCFYRSTVQAGPTDCGTINGDAQGYGFPLSFERWQGTGGVHGWIAERTAHDSPYRQGLVCKLPNLSGACHPFSMHIETRHDPSFDFLLIPFMPNNQTAVSTTATTINMTTRPEGATQPAPVWGTLSVPTSAPVNFISFDLSFAPSPGAAGLAALSVDGQPCGVVDETSTAPGTMSYAMGTAEELAPGIHTIAFRLEPRNTLPSTITIQNVATGFGQTVPNCRPDFNRDGVLAIQDIFDFLDVWFEGDSVADFDGFNGLQVADIFAFLNAWFAGCP